MYNDKYYFITQQDVGFWKKLFNVENKKIKELTDPERIKKYKKEMIDAESKMKTGGELDWKNPIPLYIDYSGGRFESWYDKDWKKVPYKTGHEIDIITAPARRTRKFKHAVLTDSAKLFSGIESNKIDLLDDYATGGTVSPKYKISYLDKKNNFRKTDKLFEGENAYEKAVKWGKSNLENFNYDMIQVFSTGGELFSGIDFIITGKHKI